MGGYVNGYQFNENFVIPLTAGTGSSIALLMNEEPRDVEVMLSHSWAEDIEQAQQAITSHLDANTAIFFCILANYQPEDRKGPSISDQLALDPFKQVIELRSLK